LGISPAWAHHYLKSGWLCRLGHGVFQFPKDDLRLEPCWKHLEHQIDGFHVGGKTAVAWRGFSHNVAAREPLWLGAYTTRDCRGGSTNIFRPDTRPAPRSTPACLPSPVWSPWSISQMACGSRSLSGRCWRCSMMWVSTKELKRRATSWKAFDRCGPSCSRCTWSTASGSMRPGSVCGGPRSWVFLGRGPPEMLPPNIRPAADGRPGKKRHPTQPLL